VIDKFRNNSVAILWGIKENLQSWLKEPQIIELPIIAKYSILICLSNSIPSIEK
jgi:hypothetical protein